MEVIQFLDSPYLPTDRFGKWGVYVSGQKGNIHRAAAADFNTELEAKQALPMMREIVHEAI